MVRLSSFAVILLRAAFMFVFCGCDYYLYFLVEPVTSDDHASNLVSSLRWNLHCSGPSGTGDLSSCSLSDLATLEQKHEALTQHYP